MNNTTYQPENLSQKIYEAVASDPYLAQLQKKKASIYTMFIPLVVKTKDGMKYIYSNRQDFIIKKIDELIGLRTHQILHFFET
jgi:hypothetical protein